MENCFLLSNLISECLHTQIISTKIFIKFLLLDKKSQGLQYCNFHQYQHIFAVAGWNHPYTISWSLLRFVLLIEKVFVVKISKYIDEKIGEDEVNWKGYFVTHYPLHIVTTPIQPQLNSKVGCDTKMTLIHHPPTPPTTTPLLPPQLLGEIS